MKVDKGRGITCSGMSEEEEHLIYFSSKFINQDPITGSFTINLPHRLELSGKWKCAILDLYVKPDITNILSAAIHILADFCSESFIAGDKLPIIRKIYLKKSSKFYNLTNTLYIPLKQSNITNFSLSILDQRFKPIIFQSSHLLEFTLHFVKS